MKFTVDAFIVIAFGIACLASLFMGVFIAKANIQSDCSNFGQSVVVNYKLKCEKAE